MIVSHRYRFIFFAQPRTGSHAIRAALRPHLADGDWEQQGLTAQLRLPVPELARIGHGHISVKSARRWLPEEVWLGYFKFAITRNPYDRLVSACAFLLRRDSAWRGNETFWSKCFLHTHARHMLIRPQADLLVDPDGGGLGIDFLGRYEELDDSFREVCRLAGLPDLRLSRANASEHPSFAACYDDSLFQSATRFYERDFDLLGYPRSLPDS